MSLDELPIFPLSNVVLFPRVQTPLHLFERETSHTALSLNQLSSLDLDEPKPFGGAVNIGMGGVTLGLGRLADWGARGDPGKSALHAGPEA